MRQYKGAVCFLDLLGIGELTRKRVELQDADYEAHGIRKTGIRTEQGFCANLLVKFRRVLRTTKGAYPVVQVAQLSDSAFLWSEQPLQLAKAVAHCMRTTVLEGLLCRGGISYGDIIEPDRVNRTIGHFVAGEAVTKAVELESAGKGCRIFSDARLPRKVDLGHFHTAPFGPLKNPLDGSVTDEFRWYVLGNRTRSSDRLEIERFETACGLLEMVALLKYSPLFRWNITSPQGEVQVASSIESISRFVKFFTGSDEYLFQSESLIGFLDNRSSNTVVRIFKGWKSEIRKLMEERKEKRRTIKVKHRSRKLA